MNKPVIAGVAAVLLALGAWWYQGREAAPPEVEPEPAPVAEAPGVQNPVPSSASDQPLPALADSDQPLLDMLANVAGRQAVQYLIPKDLIRHIVVTIDNLPRKKLALQLRPIAPTPGQLAVTGEADGMTLSPANAARYAPAVKILGATDTQALVRVYLSFYPLFQEAYEGLGYPTQHFNDRLVEVIDHLLEAPDLSGPIGLSRPSVMYVYADPAIEALSAGQKTLVRMGHENSIIVKAKLRGIRSEIAGKTPAAR